MNSVKGKALIQRADAVARMFSQPRTGNRHNETFHVDSIRIRGFSCATVIYEKMPTRKKAVAFFYWVNSGAKPRWEYFFLSYGHIAGLEMAKEDLMEVECHNFDIMEEQYGNESQSRSDEGAVGGDG